MKRKQQQPKYIPDPTHVKYWAYIQCLGEDIAIAISKAPVNVMNNFGKIRTDSVGPMQWAKGNAVFRDFRYNINFDNVKLGEKVLCPHCASPVDFRLIPANEMPTFQ